MRAIQDVLGRLTFAVYSPNVSAGVSNFVVSEKTRGTYDKKSNIDRIRRENDSTRGARPPQQPFRVMSTVNPPTVGGWRTHRKYIDPISQLQAP